ncbi:zincin-like metallopeptidase domain-containing protein [Mesorhizobium sp.]|uniref:zincin-like metallopeptidase domain-containing protein n=1 Tax=Mesorhizobium sp. TaxID=1871066 RepID=UPI0025806425|nr:zincin-like metallopeptidase domain-containing protein [Mesorhizobium sp.]
MHELVSVSAVFAVNQRLDRDLTGRFGSEGYAVEELVAELAASFLCADLGVAHDPRDNTAAYLASWLAVLKNDKRAIITAAAKTQAAAEYHTALQSAAGQEAA